MYCGLLYGSVSNYMVSHAGLIDKLEWLGRKRSWLDHLVGNYLRNLMLFPLPLHTWLVTPLRWKQLGKSGNRFRNVEWEYDMLTCPPGVQC